MKKVIGIFAFVVLVAGFAKTSLSQVLDSPPRDGVYDKKNTIEKKPVTYPWVREADVVWSKRIWRVIDLREKMNQAFYYPEVPHNDLRSLMQVLMDALKEGSITAYDASNPSDEFIVPLTYQEIMNRLERTDSVPMQRPYPPYDWYDTVISVKFNPTDVKRFRIKEDWFFDKQRSVMEVRILGICPVRDNYDEKGIFRAYDPLFWINFPEARPILAKAEVFNRYNSSARKTYDDIFWKRMFNSYVYKEDNVYDRRISDYATGVDALMEAERVKSELFNFEHNLWEF
ncbi:MAG TPA: gliding motility protein GldN [Lentimicrobium sp.]|nr:gliding motility protein GldN [Lentimicrobium sp.]